MKSLQALMCGVTLAAGGCAEAKPIGPTDLAAAIASARPGAKLVLGPGEFPALVVRGQSFSPGISIDAHNATINGIILRNVTGISINGGSVSTESSQTFGVLIDSSHGITVSGMHVTGSRIGVSVTRSQDIHIIDNDFGGIRSDGVNIAASQKVFVENNRCHDVKAILPVYDAAGKLVTDGDHPDCIQGWSVPGLPPTADVTISGNEGHGYMQGVWFGNSGQGGYDRITVRDNVFTVSAFNGIVLMEARNSSVTGNSVATTPGAKMLNFPFRSIFTWIHVTGEGNRVCGNHVQQPRTSDAGAAKACRDP